MSSSITSEAGAELETREKELNKKGRKNSVFGNLFKKRSKKSSKEDEGTAEEGPADEKSATVSNESESNEDSYQLQKPWVTSSTKYAEEGKSESSAGGAALNLFEPTNGTNQKSANEGVYSIHRDQYQLAYCNSTLLKTRLCPSRIYRRIWNPID